MKALCQKASDLVSISNKSLCYFRICFGLTIAASLVTLLSDFEWALSSTGVYSTEESFKASKFFSFYFHVNDTGAFLLLYFTFAVSVFFAFGYLGTFCKALLFVLLWQLHIRNPYLFGGWGSIQRWVLVLTLFLPLNKTEGETKNLASFALLLFIAQIYFYASMSKFGISWVTSRNAVENSLWIAGRQNELSVILRASEPAILQALTRYVLLAESLIPILIFCPATRYVAFFFMFSLHYGIEVFINVGWFSFGMLSLSLCLLPKSAWERLKI